MIWGQFLHYLLSLTSNYKSEVYDFNLLAVIHEMAELYRVLISASLTGFRYFSYQVRLAHPVTEILLQPGGSEATRLAPIKPGGRRIVHGS